MGPTALYDKGNATASTCEVCGYTSKSGNTHHPNDKHEAFNILEVTETPEILVINYKCPSCSSRMGDVFQPGVVRMKDVLERITMELIKEIRDVKEELIKKNKEYERLKTITKIRTPSTEMKNEEEEEVNLQIPRARKRKQSFLPDETEGMENDDKQPEVERSHVEVNNVWNGRGELQGTVMDFDSVEPVPVASSSAVFSIGNASSYTGRPLLLSFGSPPLPLPLHIFPQPSMPVPQPNKASLLTVNKKKRKPYKRKSEYKRSNATLKCPHPNCTSKFMKPEGLQSHIGRKHEGDPNPFKCLYPGCKRKFDCSGRLKRHEIMHSSDEKQFKCEECGKSYWTENSRNTHFRITHKMEPLKCPECPDLSFVTQDSLERHSITIHKVKKWPLICDFPGCEKGYLRKSDLKKHQDFQHSFGVRVCPEEGCGKEFKNQTYLDAHLKLHDQGLENLKCPKCDKEFDNYHSFKGHVRHHDTPPVSSEAKERFPCPHEGCAKKFETAGKLRVHMDSHSEEAKYLCEICGKSCKTAVSRTSHMKSTHSEESVKCLECPQVFRNRERLKKHQCLSHGKEWPFPCKENGCDKGFLHESHLTYHVDTYHRKGVHLCSFEGCGKKFLNRRYLKSHEEMHQKGLDTLECCKCDREFDNFEAFNKHQKAHENLENKRYQCRYCSKIFPNPKQMKEHVDRHKGVRKYQCQSCGRLFATPGNLKIHKRLVHEQGRKPRPNRTGILVKKTSS